MTGPPNAADIEAIKSQFAATMLGSLAERPKMDLKRAMKGAPDEVPPLPPPPSPQPSSLHHVLRAVAVLPQAITVCDQAVTCVLRL